MTINDIVLRDLMDEDARHERDHFMRECEIRRRRRKAAGEIVAGALVLALIILVAWLFLVVTPDQYSAECEALRAELEAQGK